MNDAKVAPVGVMFLLVVLGGCAHRHAVAPEAAPGDAARPAPRRLAMKVILRAQLVTDWGEVTEVDVAEFSRPARALNADTLAARTTRSAFGRDYPSRRHRSSIGSTSR